MLTPWPAASSHQGNCCESSQPARAGTNWPSRSVKSDGSNEGSSSPTGCQTPICSAGPTRPEQGRGSSRSQVRDPDRALGRNVRPLQRGPALPRGRAQPALCRCHLPECRPSRRSSQTAESRRPDHRARTLGPHLTLGWAHILLTGEYRWPKRRKLP